MKLMSHILLQVGGKEHKVRASDITPETTLNTYLRDIMHLTATKKMCLEGGCGTCTVAVESQDSNGKRKVFAVNSCLVSIFSCHGWKILTNEGIGNPLIGYDSIQHLLADNNGSQCGFCSSGMVMNMYALTQSGSKTKEEIEKAFGGNLCRCTGYRPILTAFKTLASDAEEEYEIIDLEDMLPCKKDNCATVCSRPCSQASLIFDLGQSQWMKVHFLQDLLKVLKTIGNKSYQLVAGNTARGVYWLTSYPEVYIDVSTVAELTKLTIEADKVTFGGNCSLTFVMDNFNEIATTHTQFSYMKQMADHIDLVAHIPVRNIGTLAGNLMIKHEHHEFPSDIFLILETVNASIVIVDVDNNVNIVSPMDFLKIDMRKRVIREIVLKAYDISYSYMSYKIMPRAQNAHALVNAGFLLKFRQAGVVQTARIVYGAINPDFVHASNAEAALPGKNLFDNNTLQTVFKALDAELKPDWVLPDPRPEFRKQLAINLFYKYVLSIAPDNQVNPRNRSGGTLLYRPVSNGSQQIYSKKELYPLTQPVIKLESLAQTSGQAKYILDLPDLPGQLHGVLVQARAIPGSTLKGIDASAALAEPDIVAFFSAKDIPGLNDIAVVKCNQMVSEPLFCKDKVLYYSQPVGILVALNHDAAYNAAELVEVSTELPSAKALFTVREVLKAGATDRIKHRTSVVATSRGTDIQTVIKGETSIEGQYHFHMENQNCVVVPTEDGINIFAGTQWMDHIQGVVSQVLNIPSQKICIFVRRLGGGFGAKLSRNGFVSGAAALAAYKLNRPVRIWMEFNDNMDIMGKRYPCLCQYEVGVNNIGKIQYLQAKLYSDFGVGGNEPIDFLLVSQFKNCYLVDTWTFDTYTVQTDMVPFCFTRAPGSLEGQACIETIMDHIAHTLKLDPLDVRKQNLNVKDNQILLQFINEIESSDDIQKRKANITSYNSDNRWKKKALSIVPMRYTQEVLGTFTTLVSIYHLDGGVAVSHGGIEMGQGINTKVAQVCAYKFGIPIEKVSVKPNYNVIAPNSFMSGGSLTSEAVVFSLLKACDVLLDRIKPIRDQNPTVSWEDLIQLCYSANISLSTNGFFSTSEPEIREYQLFGCCALELEVDILTGKYEVGRVDILEDVGQSMSPLIDIGQLEGAFVMGLGYHAMEELIMDPTTGRLTNNRTWTYKIMGFRDIPADFRVKFSNNTFNPVGVLKSKAIAEPPTCLTISLPLAIRMALASARAEANPSASTWYPIDSENNNWTCF